MADAFLNSRLRSWLERRWYGSSVPFLLRAPAWLFLRMVRARRRAFEQGRRLSSRPPVPVIVVGNITVGGTGKTPLTAWLAARLQAAGRRPVIVSRGYGGSGGGEPRLVSASSRPEEVGDEPLMLHEQTGVPVVVCPDRVRAVGLVVQEKLGDIIICDDGLQHYALERDLELVVFDGSRGLGNGAMLPAGPLREPIERLAHCHCLAVTGPPDWSRFPSAVRDHHHLEVVTLVPVAFTPLGGGEPLPPEAFAGRRVHGVAGIGRPERFFASLRELGCQVEPHPFPDHHPFRDNDLPWRDAPIIMTAKDAVKCRTLGLTNAWVLEVRAQPGPGLEAAVDRWLNDTLALKNRAVKNGF